MEGLCRIQLPLLKKLFLSSSAHHIDINNITTFKEFRKSSFRLQAISICSNVHNSGNNPISEYPWLSWMPLGQAEEIYFSKKSKTPTDNITTLVKMQALKLSRVGNWPMMQASIREGSSRKGRNKLCKGDTLAWWSNSIDDRMIHYWTQNWKYNLGRLKLNFPSFVLASWPPMAFPFQAENKLEFSLLLWRMLWKLV